MGSQSDTGAGLLVLGVDTCGPAGTVALARIGRPTAEISRSTAWESGQQLTDVLEQITLEGRTYSSTLISGIEGLLTGQGVGLKDVEAIVVVNGPGSFTGIRVGVSAVKGLAEPGQLPVVAVSRLSVLAAKAGVGSAALDAHRHEVFLRGAAADGSSRQLLAGAEDISHISEARCGAPTIVAVCDDAAAALLGSAWPAAELARVEAPTAADAIQLCVPAILAGEFADLSSLDGHYLRRSDAEIFGPGGEGAAKEASGIQVRRMTEGDLDPVLEIAAQTDHAPKWTRQAYVAALDPGNQPRRIALVAEDKRGAGLVGFAIASLLGASGAGASAEGELESIVTAVPHQRRGVGRELCAFLKAELRRCGVGEVILEVREGNHGARGFYRSLGFREEGRRRGYYADPEEDAVLMRLTAR